MEEKTACAHCRTPLDPCQLVPVRFMEELAQQLNQLKPKDQCLGR